MIEQESATMAEETVPGFWTLAQVWWSLTWRTILWVILSEIVLFIFFFIVGCIAHFAGVDPHAMLPLLRITGFVLGLGLGLWSFTMAFRALLGKTFSGYKLLFLQQAG